MKKITATILPIVTFISTAAFSADIELTINGNGTIKALEADMSCNENCTITNDLAINTLQVTSGSDQFTGWTGQQCDSGNGVILGDTKETLGNVPDGAKTLVSADIDQDNDLDLAYISLFDGQIGIFLNEGNGEFSKRPIEFNLNYPAALAFYDWDNDGDHDLLVTEYDAAQIKLYSNNGLGDYSFSKNIVISGYKPYGISVQDINQDNIPDIAISSFQANTGGNLQILVDSIRNAKTAWLTNNGQDEFELAYELSNHGGITLDSHFYPLDNKLELAAAEVQSGDVALYTVNLITEEVTRTVVDNGLAAYGVALNDIDNNGTIDVFTSHYQPAKLQLNYRQNDSSFVKATGITGFADGVTATALVDVDNNGYLDLLTGEFNSNKFLSIKTQGYKDCVITKDSKISITANFAAQATTPAPSTPSSNSSGSSGGGSLGWGSVIMVLFLLVMRSPILNRTKANKICNKS